MIKPEVLKEFSFFAGLDDEALKSLSAIANEISFQSGKFIFNEGDSAYTLYLLLDGWVDVVIETTEQGECRQLVTSLIPGDIFGLSAVIEPYAYTTSAVCASPVKVMGFDKADLQALFESNQRLCYTIIIRICQIIASRLRATRQQMVSTFVMN